MVESTQQEPTTEDDEQETTTTTEPYISHVKNAECHPAWLRYGIPFYLLCTFVLLLNADIGSGLSADYVLVDENGIVEQYPLLTASIVSSVKELWHNGSYPMAILIAITSIAWPYIKLLLSLCAWILPYRNPRKREVLIEVVDALGKWSFVDIIVFVEVMVAFRSTIPVAPPVYVEIVVVPKWGFFGFVLATMFSLAGTHIILYYHRKVIYRTPSIEDDNGQDNKSNNNNNDMNQQQVEEGKPKVQDDDDSVERMKKVKIGGIIAIVLVIVGMVFYLLGSLLDILEMSNASDLLNAFSIASIGREIPPSSLEPNDVGIRFIQAMWFFLGIVMPLWCSIMFASIYGYICFFSSSTATTTTTTTSNGTKKPSRLEWFFFMSEIAFSWSCAEVLLVSTLFAVLQLPTFGNGLIKANCQYCPQVGSNLLLPNFIYLCIGTVLNVAVNIWIYNKTHHVVFNNYKK